MKINVTANGFRELLDDIEGDIAGAATGAMRETLPEARAELKAQVVSAGLGTRLANTWRGETYPQSRRSLNPAGMIWSRAPDIIDAFARGAKIVPVAGSRYLAIPSDNVPRAGGRRGSTRRMSPVEVQGAFNQELIFRRGDRGRLLAFVSVIKARRGGAYRRATKGRLAQGRERELVLMFTMVPTVRLPKLLDLDDVAQRWSRRFEAEFTRRLSSR